MNSENALIAKMLSESIEGIGKALVSLGNAGAVEPFGAIEAHSMMVKESGRLISDAIESQASAIAEVGNQVEKTGSEISNALNSIAKAIASHANQTSYKGR